MSELPPVLQRVFDQMKESGTLYNRAMLGTLETPLTREYHFTGETRAEALGKAYSMRDTFRDSGYEATAEYLRLADEQHECFDGDRHVVRIHVESSDED